MSAQIKTLENSFSNQKLTKRAIIWTSLLNEPLFSVFVLLGVILRKDLGASAFQITLLMMLKPLVAILSFYWSSAIRGRSNKLKGNMLLAGILLRAPFLFFPCMENTWFFVLSGACYMLFYRAGNPAWIEILKQNLPKQEREKTYSLGSSLGFGISVLLAIVFGKILEGYTYSWKWIFVISASIGLVSLIIQSKVPIFSESAQKKPPALSWKEYILGPWQDCFTLMQKRPDFSAFQWAFMIGGFGLMLFQPVLPLFFVDVLNLSYMDMSIALLICKGLGFCFSSALWTRVLRFFHLRTVTSLVCFLFGLFPIILFLAPVYLSFVYLAHVIYGVASAGSHLIWNLSGPIFAKEEDSARYSSVNVVMVGLRGAVGPPLGGILSPFFGPAYVLLIGMFLCFLGGVKILLPQKNSLQKNAE